MTHGKSDGTRLLAFGLFFTLFAHGAAVVLMGLVLAPMLPGGGLADDMTRAAMVAQKPILYRVGWAGWQITALSDVVLGVALLRARFVPRLPAVVAFVCVLVAVVPDQWAQVLLVLRGPELAARDPVAFLAFEREVFPLTSAWAACAYTLAAAAWSWCFWAAKIWTRALHFLSWFLWPLFMIASVGALLGLHPIAVAVGNAIGFFLLEVWLVLVIEALLRRDRPFTTSGAQAPWRHPQGGIFGRALDAVANSRFLRALGSVAPDLAFVSDIEDVIYVTWVVPASQVEHLVPEGLALERVGPDEDHAIFTFLTYRHGHFAPRATGPLRRFAPSPVQSNWRIHVRDPRTGKSGITFVTNAVSSTLYALAARTLADGMPMHVPARATLARDGATLRLAMDGGAGTAPDCEATLREASARELPEALRPLFPSYDAFLEIVVPQDRAFSTQPWRDQITRHEIVLGIPLAECVPLEGEVRSKAANALAGPLGTPVCFLVRRVAFRLDRIERDVMTP